MSYGRYVKNYYTTALVKENPNHGVRLRKISKEEELDDYSKGFLESLLEFYNKSGGLTDRQLASFEKIESRFSPQEKAKLVLWKQEYLEKHKKDAMIIAKYYSRTGYYHGVASRILGDEKYIPPKDKWERMMKNQYAQKVLEAARSDPKFALNDKVQVRGTAGSTIKEYDLKPYRMRLGFVLANDLPIVNAVKGAKRYNVLLMGESNTIDIDERYLMKPNRKGKTS